MARQFDRRETIFLKQTGTGAIALSVAEGKALLLHEVRVNYVVPPTAAANLTIIINDAIDAYDQLVHDVNQAALERDRFAPAVPWRIEAGNTVDIAYVNADAREFGIVAVIEYI